MSCELRAVHGLPRDSRLMTENELGRQPGDQP
jgi:hypothetical protein